MKLKLNFQYTKNKGAFTLLEVIISIIILSFIMLALIQFKDRLLSDKNEKLKKVEQKRYLDDASLFIENKLKNIDGIQIVKSSKSYSSHDLMVFKYVTKRPQNYNYFFFELKDKKLCYKAYNNKYEAKVITYQMFSSGNSILDDVEEFNIEKFDNTVKFSIKDMYGNESLKTIFTGDLDE